MMAKMTNSTMMTAPTMKTGFTRSRSQALFHRLTPSPPETDPDSASLSIFSFLRCP